MKKLIKLFASFLLFGFFIFLGLGSDEGEEKCGCPLPNITIPDYANSWEDKKENWEFKECAEANSDKDAEKIHVYVFYNKKLDKYRCELKYSYPGTECSGRSKSFGLQAISTADISKTDFTIGSWKNYSYWIARQF